VTHHSYHISKSLISLNISYIRFSRYQNIARTICGWIGWNSWGIHQESEERSGGKQKNRPQVLMTWRRGDAIWGKSDKLL
jgi:hypothetical protein